jgi:hypothetical protein
MVATGSEAIGIQPGDALLGFGHRTVSFTRATVALSPLSGG